MTILFQHKSHVPLMLKGTRFVLFLDLRSLRNVQKRGQMYVMKRHRHKKNQQIQMGIRMGMAMAMAMEKMGQTGMETMEEIPMEVITENHLVAAHSLIDI
jgi:hypothetical protein